MNKINATLEGGTKGLSRVEVEILAKTLMDGLFSIMGILGSKRQCTRSEYTAYETAFEILRDLQLKIPLPENIEDCSLDPDLASFYYSGNLVQSSDGTISWQLYC